MKPTKKDLEKLYTADNRSMQYIADQYNTYRKKVSDWLKEYGIQIKDPHEKREIPKKSDLIDLYNSGKRICDISKMYKSSENLVSRWFKQYGIETFDVTVRKFPVPLKKTLIKLYSDEKLTIKQIAGHFDTSKDTVRRWFLHHNIYINSNQRKYEHLRAIPLTKQQIDYLIGVMLGDGHLNRGGKRSNTRLNLCHTNKQFEYFLYNKKIFNNFVNNVYETDRVDKRTGNRYHGWSFTSIKHPGMNKIHTMFYKNNRKIIPHDIANYLNGYIMALWIMDDGWLNGKTNIRLSTDGFTRKENETLIFAIKVCFGINGKVNEYTRRNKKYCYLSFNKENSIKLTKLVDQFVIPSMKYKLVCSSTTTCQTS